MLIHYRNPAIERIKRIIQLRHMFLLGGQEKISITKKKSKTFTKHVPVLHPELTPGAVGEGQATPLPVPGES
jgi:hypothetical protein